MLHSSYSKNNAETLEASFINSQSQFSCFLQAKKNIQCSGYFWTGKTLTNFLSIPPETAPKILQPHTRRERFNDLGGEKDHRLEMQIV